MEVERVKESKKIFFERFESYEVESAEDIDERKMFAMIYNCEDKKIIQKYLEAYWHGLNESEFNDFGMEGGKYHLIHAY